MVRDFCDHSNAICDRCKLPDLVRDWNARYVTPRLVISTVSAAFAALEQEAGDALPVVRGDMTAFWEDGAASTARETALGRAASERLAQAEGEGQEGRGIARTREPLAERPGVPGIGRQPEP